MIFWFICKEYHRILLIVVAAFLILKLIIHFKIMKAPAPTVLNKKLILHFDVDQVLRLPSSVDKDLFVYDLCSAWIWGRLQKNSKEDPQKITGWKIASNSLTLQSPQPDLLSYKSYVQQYLKPSNEQYEKLILNLSKGPCSKAKSQIEKNIKNITLPKTLGQAIKQSVDPNNKLLVYYNKTGKYQILPAFYKLLLNLKKNKRQFAIIIKNNNIKDYHIEIINELNLFFSGEHPLYNGKNGTPTVKWDGSKGNKNFIIEETHQAVFYVLGEGELFATYGTLNVTEEKDPQMFKQKFKSFKSVKLCGGIEEIYAVSHTILAQSACIYEINPLNSLVVDPVDYLTHQIYFTSNEHPKIYSCLGEEIADRRTCVMYVDLFDYLKDVDYFIKSVETLESQRSAQINKNEKGEAQQQQEELAAVIEKPESNHAYLKKHLLPVLQGALRQVDLLRPQDPIGFIALYCLKNRDKLQ